MSVLKCPKCNGRGEYLSFEYINGWIRWISCPDCYGTGIIRVNKKLPDINWAKIFDEYLGNKCK